MVGQKELISKLDSYDASHFPKTILFAGPRGCGKHTIVEHLRSRLDISASVNELTDVDLETVSSIYLNPIPTVYLINLTIIDYKKQNLLLKLVEEPPVSAFIMFITENLKDVMDTISSRCIVFQFAPYTDEELKETMVATDNADLILKAARTPGQIQDLDLDKTEAMFNLGHTIITKLAGANFANSFVIADKINCGDEVDKFDPDIFFNILSYQLFEAFMFDKNPKLLKLYRITQEYRNKLGYKKLNLKSLLDNYIIYIWELMNGTE